MNRLIKWLQGYLVMQIEGERYDQIFRMCKAHHIVLRQIDVIDQYLYVIVLIKDYFEFIKIIRKNNARGKVLIKRGFPFLLKKIIKKTYFYLLVLVTLLFLFISQKYIWAIEITGNQRITVNQIMDFLSNEEICYGMKQSNISCEEIEQKMRDFFPVMTWVSVYINGTKLHIDVKENDLNIAGKRTVKDNICSNVDGEIISILVKQGDCVVKTGDIVHKGDLLISGKIPVYDEEQNIKNYQHTNADARIRILTNLPYHDHISNTYSVTEFYPKVKYHLFVEFWGKRYYCNYLFPGKNITETLTMKKQCLLLDQLYLPLFYGYEKVRNVEMKYYVYSDKEMKKILSDNLSKYILCLRQKGVQIIEKNVKISKNGSVMYLNGDIQVIETIE